MEPPWPQAISQAFAEYAQPAWWAVSPIQSANTVQSRMLLMSGPKTLVCRPSPMMKLMLSPNMMSYLEFFHFSGFPVSIFVPTECNLPCGSSSSMMPIAMSSKGHPVMLMSSLGRIWTKSFFWVLVTQPSEWIASMGGFPSSWKTM